MQIVRRGLSASLLAASLVSVLTLGACNNIQFSSSDQPARSEARPPAPLPPRGNTPRFAYVTSAANGSTPGAVWEFRVSPKGELSAVTTVDAGKDPRAITLDQTGRYAYVANDDLNDNMVFQYTIGADGSLNPMATPAVATESVGASNIVADPTGRFVYVAHWNSSTVSQYAIGAGGALTSLGAPMKAGDKASWIAIDPRGRHAYVVDEQEDQILQYNITGNGTLVPMRIPSVRSASGPNFMAIDPSGRYAYVTNGLEGSYGISAYSINPENGQLAQISCGPAGAKGCKGSTQPSNFAAGGEPVTFAFVPHHADLLITQGNGTLARFAIGADGRLSPAGRTRKVANGPAAVVIDPSGHYVYVANKWGNDISQMKLGPTLLPVPMPRAKVGAGSKPSSIAILAR
jgi:6-phosphogluconolactonase (cycloisomerase 2 family)